MQIPNLTLAYQLAELKPAVEGSIVRNVQELSRNWLKLRLQTRQGTKDLILAPSTFFLTSFSFPAKQMTSGYGAFLRKHLKNKKILSLKQQGFDRIALIEFQEHFLILELFAKGNVILTDKKMQTQSAFRKEQWKDRILRKGKQYNFPSSKGLNPLKVSLTELKKLFKASESDAVRALISTINIAPILAEAACSQAGIEKEKKASALKEKELTALNKAVKESYSIALEKEKPVLIEKGTEQILLPFPLTLPAARILQKFPSLNDAIDSIYSKQFASDKTSPEDQAAGKKQVQLDRSIERQKKAIGELQQAIELNKAKANAIYVNYTQISQLIEEAKPFVGGKNQKEEVMYKLKKRFPFLQELDLRTGKAVLKLSEKEL